LKQFRLAGDALMEMGAALELRWVGRKKRESCPLSHLKGNRKRYSRFGVATMYRQPDKESGSTSQLKTSTAQHSPSCARLLVLKCCRPSVQLE
jgi:hypothetical protein